MSVSGNINTTTLLSGAAPWVRESGFIDINVAGSGRTFVYIVGPANLDEHRGTISSGPSGTIDIPYLYTNELVGANTDTAGFGDRGEEVFIWLKTGYVSGSQISLSETLSDRSISGSTRLYSWTLNNGDKVTVEVVPGISLSSTAAVHGSSASGSTVDFTATFGKDATGVDKTDFALTATGSAAGTISSVTAVSASTYTVSVTGVVGTGKLRLDLNASGTGIQDTSNPA